MTNLIVKDIFRTVQGEGFHTGSPALFLRFAGCSVKCEWCDTDWKNGKIFPVDELVTHVLEKLKELPEQRLVITGGEPLDQKNLLKFFRQYTSQIKNLMRPQAYPISMETSCSANSWIVRNDFFYKFLYLTTDPNLYLYITCSPKLSVRKSQIESDIAVASLISRSFNAEMKVVIDTDESFEQLLKLELLISDTFKNYYIMFEDNYLKNNHDLQDKYLDFLSKAQYRWKISSRLHKQINFS